MKLTETNHASFVSINHSENILRLQSIFPEKITDLHLKIEQLIMDSLFFFLFDLFEVMPKDFKVDETYFLSSFDDLHSFFHYLILQQGQ